MDVDFPLRTAPKQGWILLLRPQGVVTVKASASVKNSEVLIFQSPDWRAPPELEQLAGNMREVMRNHRGDLLSPDALTMLFLTLCIVLKVMSWTRRKFWKRITTTVVI